MIVYLFVDKKLGKEVKNFENRNSWYRLCGFIKWYFIGSA